MNEPDVEEKQPKLTCPDRPRCIVCGQEGKLQMCDRVPIQPKGTVRRVRTKTASGATMFLESGDLAVAYMVGPGSPPDKFPGDPTGTQYYGSGVSAYVQYHPECKGHTVEGYNSFLRTFSAQMADDEEWVYDYEKPESEGPWRGAERPRGWIGRAIAIPSPGEAEACKHEWSDLGNGLAKCDRCHDEIHWRTIALEQSEALTELRARHAELQEASLRLIDPSCLSGSRTESHDEQTP
jgi:hypothetical protein